MHPHRTNSVASATPDHLSSVSYRRPVPFALSPSTLVSNVIIDYRTTSRSKLFKGASLQWGTRVVISNSSLHNCLKDCLCNDIQMGAHPCLMYPPMWTSPSALGQLVNLITHYGRVMIKQVCMYAATYVTTPVTYLPLRTVTSQL